ncbi:MULTISPECIES: prepilin-type N-terminal cleavage/methylation domain-containing protein [unclassified Psychrobacter]|uniref:prepilin-type N-terminal cleavage/methylation domain-containing protein n=1 Tax=unclassified Psychrobacter TaxID=196806 RepID=UPI003FD18112
MPVTPQSALYLLPTRLPYKVSNHHASHYAAVNGKKIEQACVIYIDKSVTPLPVNISSQAGFTLVEILVVVVILSIFAGMISLSVGSSDSRKNRAFYEHITDSLSYVRLLSAERMQPMGLALQADKQGQVAPVIMTLSNPYIAYQRSVEATDISSTPKNAMELSADIANNEQTQAPSWNIEPDITLPTMPAGVSVNIQRLDDSSMSNRVIETRTLQPWFTDQTVPQVLWFGTGQATPVTIEIRHDSRLVGEVITIMPDGNIVIGQEI